MKNLASLWYTTIFYFLLSIIRKQIQKSLVLVSIKWHSNFPLYHYLKLFDTLEFDIGNID